MCRLKWWWWQCQANRVLPNRPSPVIDQFLASAVPIVGAGDVHLRNIAGSNPAPTQTSHSLSEDDTFSAETASLTTQESVPYELDDLYSISGSD